METKLCSKCGEVKCASQFYCRKASPDGLSYKCKQCTQEANLLHYDDNKDKYKASARKWKENNRWKYTLGIAKLRAKKQGVPFDLDVGDIIEPSHCPVLGIPLKRGSRGQRDNSPSLDRIIPALGYTKGNVIVVSMRANRIKNNATIEELSAVAEFYKELTDADQTE